MKFFYKIRKILLQLQSLKADVNDYTFKAELRKETNVSIKGKPVSVKAISVYIPEPIIRDQEAIWKAKGIKLLI